MKTRPIIFSSPMVRAILSGRKTQTRRVVRCTPELGWPDELTQSPDARLVGDVSRFCHVGRAGDRLWVKESLLALRNDYLRTDHNGFVGYDDGCFVTRVEESDAGEVRSGPVDWAWSRNALPAMFCPRWASRINLLVTGVRVQRVQDISEEDAQAEGVEPVPVHGKLVNAGLGRAGHWSARKAFSELWDSINAKRGFGWDVNPWVWAVNFEATK